MELIQVGEEELKFGLRRSFERIAKMATSIENAMILISGGLTSDRVISDVGVLEFSSGADWQHRTVEYLTSIPSNFDQKGVIADDNALKTVHRILKGLSDAPFPSAYDTELVNEAAKAYGIDGAIRRRIETSKIFNRALSWRYSSSLDAWLLGQGEQRSVLVCGDRAAFSERRLARRASCG